MNFQVIATAQKALSITILLEGKLDFSYDNLVFSLDTNCNKSALIVNLTKPASFRRTLYRNNKVSKLHIVLPLSWVQSRNRNDHRINAFIT